MSGLLSRTIIAAANATVPAPAEEDSAYGYTPTRYVCYIFVVLFGLSTLLHIGQAVWYKRWFMLFTAGLCGVGEVVGWAGRLWSSYNVLADDAFMMQITATILSPTFLVAANFIILATIIRYLGPQYSRLSPRLYTIIFCSCDVISLVIQGTGGGIASAADDHDGTQLGGNIMLGGIVFQLVSIVIYTALAAEFFLRYLTRRPISGRVASATPSAPAGAAELGEPTPNSSVVQVREKELEHEHSMILKRVKIIGVALAFSTIVILIRSIYRTIELADGWDGRIITTEVYFNVLDGVMIVLAIYTLNFFHPGRFLP